jgi:Transposase DDE domain
MKRSCKETIMNPLLPDSPYALEGSLPGTTFVPVEVAAFARATLDRLPLAESVLLLWQQVADAPFLQGVFDQHRGRAYDKVLSFPSLVQLLADALLQHDGSARASFERAVDHDALPVSIQAAYGKLRRLPIAVSNAFLSDGTARLRALLPVRPAAGIPPSLQAFTVTVLDGKAIKRVAKRLKLLRGIKGGVLGGKTLVALELNSGLAVAMRAHPDGESNELRLVPELVPEVRRRLPGPRLWVADRQFCDLEQTGRFATADDHFLVRYHPKVHFHLDPERRARHGTDAQGRRYVEDWGWLGAATDPRRRYVRRITLTRPADEDLILVTDLVDADQYPATELLATYEARWGIENVFQQITEVFPLKRLIGGTPQAGIFQMAFCLLLYNMIHVLRAYVAAAVGWQPAQVSLEKLFDDVERELIAWTVLVEPAATVAVFGVVLSLAQVRQRLSKLLRGVWQERWLKAVNEQPRPQRAAQKASRAHTSVHRVLEDARRQHNKAQQTLKQ